jgi:1-phosphofructokinase
MARTMRSPTPEVAPDARPRVAVFGPHPLLTVTIERRGGADDVHLHAGGQGVWVSRAAAELGAAPVLVGLLGGETGAVLGPLLEELLGDCRMTAALGSSGCVVVDRRDGERRLVAGALATAPARHELDDLVSAACAEALGSRSLVICNPYPGDTLPLDLYGMLAADVRGSGIPVLVDLSSPRLDSALEGGPDVVKLNDWELAEFVRDSVEGPARLRAAAERLLERGARAAIVTRGPEPALVLEGDRAWELIPPRFTRGRREGCGDTMMGALAAALARGLGWEEALVLGAAAGAANFLRHGLGTAGRPVVEALAGRVQLRRI